MILFYRNKQISVLIQIYHVTNFPMKSFYKTFNIPLGEKVFQNKQLLSTLQEVAQREEQIMNEKLMREQQIQNRIKMLEKNYQTETAKKQQKIKAKLQKSEKNRVQFLEKIVKRCQDKDKYVTEKVKATTSKRKQSLRDAWKAATKFNQKILQSRAIHHKSQEKLGETQNQPNKQNLNRSVIIKDQKNDEIMLSSANKQGHSKSILSSFGNKGYSKTQQNVVYHSTFMIDHKMQRLNKPISIQIHSASRNYTTQQNPQFSHHQRFKRILTKHQQNLIQEQTKKIQQFGQRLQKINISRRKRDQLHKSRAKKNSVESRLNYEDDFYKKRQEKLNKKYSQRIKSESCNRSKRASDWSEINQQRREQYFKAQLENGNKYLSENKMRFLKEMMSKSIAYDALQRKLYQERFRPQ